MKCLTLSAENHGGQFAFPRILSALLRAATEWNSFNWLCYKGLVFCCKHSNDCISLATGSSAWVKSLRASMSISGFPWQCQLHSKSLSSHRAIQALSHSLSLCHWLSFFSFFTHHRSHPCWIIIFLIFRYPWDARFSLPAAQEPEPVFRRIQ